MTGPAKTTGAPWVQKTYPARRGEPPAVEFCFTPAYLSQLWARRRVRAIPTRSGLPTGDEETLLLDDVIIRPNGSILVRAWLVPAKPDYFSIRVEVSAPQPLPRHARVVLYWDTHEYAVRLTAGQMHFEDISMPDFSLYNRNLPSRRLRMRFEFEGDYNNGTS